MTRCLRGNGCCWRHFWRLMQRAREQMGVVGEREAADSVHKLKSKWSLLLLVMCATCAGVACGGAGDELVDVNALILVREDGESGAEEAERLVVDQIDLVGAEVDLVAEARSPHVHQVDGVVLHLRVVDGLVVGRQLLVRRRQLVTRASTATAAATQLRRGDEHVIAVVEESAFAI